MGGMVGLRRGYYYLNGMRAMQTCKTKDIFNYIIFEMCYDN